MKPVFSYEQGRRPIAWLDKKGRKCRLKGPLWKQGDWVAFDQTNIAALAKRLDQALLDMGRVGAVYRLDVKPLSDKGLAELLIEIGDEGALARVQEISLTGNQPEQSR